MLIDKARATAGQAVAVRLLDPRSSAACSAAADEVKEIDEHGHGAFRRRGTDGWMIQLADGSDWAQTDDAPLGLPPRKGDKVVVKRGSFGAFYLRLNGQPGFKVKRSARAGSPPARP